MEHLSEIFIGLPVAPNSGMGFLYLKTTKWRTAHPEGVACPTPTSMGQFLLGGEGSFRVDWRTNLEVDLGRTQNYCLELLVLYPRRVIIYVQYSMMLF